LMLENSIYSVISPEGCASILWKDVSKSDLAAKALKLTSKDLLDLKVVDQVIGEPIGGAHRDPEATFESVKSAIEKNLKEVMKVDPEERVAERFAKYSRMGVYVEEA